MSADEEAIIALFKIKEVVDRDVFKPDKKFAGGFSTAKIKKIVILGVGKPRNVVVDRETGRKGFLFPVVWVFCNGEDRSLKITWKVGSDENAVDSIIPFIFKVSECDVTSYVKDGKTYWHVADRQIRERENITADHLYAFLDEFLPFFKYKKDDPSLMLRDRVFHFRYIVGTCNLVEEMPDFGVFRVLINISNVYVIVKFPTYLETPRVGDDVIVTCAVSSGGRYVLATGVKKKPRDFMIDDISILMDDDLDD